jgi:hypothetical protein
MSVRNTLGLFLLLVFVGRSLPDACSLTQRRPSRDILFPFSMVLRGGGPWDTLRETALSAASIMLSKLSKTSGDGDEATDVNDDEPDPDEEDTRHPSMERWGVIWSGKRSRFQCEDEGVQDKGHTQNKSTNSERGCENKPPSVTHQAPVRPGVDYAKFDQIDESECDEDSREPRRNFDWEAGERVGEVKVEDDWDPYVTLRPSDDAQLDTMDQAPSALDEEELGGLDVAMELPKVRLKNCSAKPVHTKFSEADFAHEEDEEMQSASKSGEASVRSSVSMYYIISFQMSKF